MDDMTTEAALDWAAGGLSTLQSSNETDARITVQKLDVHYFVWVYVSPFVFFVGLIGNILSIAVLQSKTFRHTTTGVYLPLTAAADIVVLLSGLLELLEVAEVFNAREHNVWMCRAYKVLFYTAGDVSIWLLVAFTFDRFIAVCFPLKKRRVCTWKRAIIASCSIIVLALAKNFHEFWTRGLEYKSNGDLRRVCGSPEKYRFFLNYVRPWIVFAVVTALPFLLILVFNCSIVYSLIKAQRMRNKAAATQVATATGSGATSSGFRQTTFMCLGISFAFLICIAPSIVLLIGKPNWRYLADGSKNMMYKNAKAVSNFLVFVNHSLNFFLYCVTGKRFRNELVALVTCGRHRHGRSDTPITTQTGASTGNVNGNQARSVQSANTKR